MTRSARGDSDTDPAIPLEVAVDGRHDVTDLLAAWRAGDARAADRLFAAGQVVECRFFGGLTDDETGEALHVTARTLQRDWARAKDWLRRALDA